MDTVAIGLISLGMFATTVVMTLWTVRPENAQSVEEAFHYTTWPMM